MSAQKFKKGSIYLIFISMFWVLPSCSTKDDSTDNSLPSLPPMDQNSSSSSEAANPNTPSSSSTTAIPGTSSNSEVAGSSSSISSTTPSSSATGSQACTEYEPAFCGGLAYAEVPSNSTTMPGTGKCLFIGDFEQIQPNLNSTVAVNGVEVTLGSAWDGADSTMFSADPSNNHKAKPAKKDGGYYVFVKTGTINSYQNNGWKTIVAKAKPDCGGAVQSSSSRTTASSSSRAVSSSSVAAASSSSRAVAVASSSSRASATCSAKREKTEIAYIPAGTAGVNNTRHKLDLTLPSTGNGPFPLVIFLHGGGFTGGSKADDPGASGSAPSKNYALASVGYRLSGETGGKFPGSFNDILTAIRFLRANADKYCLDPDKFVITGFSAGAWHAGMVCVLSGYENHGLDGWESLYPGVSNKVQACVTYSALTDMAYLAEDEAKNPNVKYMMANHGATSPEAGFLNINAALNTLPETGPPNASIRWKANPLNYVTTKTPPIYMIAAEDDNVVPWQQSPRLVDKINSVVPGRAVFDQQKTGGHSGFTGRSTQVFDFLNQNLK